MLLLTKVRLFIVAMVTKQILKNIYLLEEHPENAFLPYFEKLKSLDIWLTDGIIGDLGN